jgi:transcriptional regulator NrdR family protein
MKCPNCGHPDHRVIASEAREGRVHRRRECDQCKKRWNTIEAPEVVYQEAATVVEIGRQLRNAIGE